MSLVESIKQGIKEAFIEMGLSLMNWVTEFLDQFIIFLLLFIILSNVMGFKGFNKIAGLSILLWVILKAVAI